MPKWLEMISRYDDERFINKPHVRFGDGNIDIIERLHIADEQNAGCVLETKTIKALRDSVAYLKNINGKAKDGKTV